MRLRIEARKVIIIALGVVLGNYILRIMDWITYG